MNSGSIGSTKLSIILSYGILLPCERCNLIQTPKESRDSIIRMLSIYIHCLCFFLSLFYFLFQRFESYCSYGSDCLFDDISCFSISNLSTARHSRHDNGHGAPGHNKRRNACEQNYCESPPSGKCNGKSTNKS